MDALKRLCSRFSACKSAAIMLTYTIDFFDEVLEDKRGGEPIIRIDGVCGNVLKDHLHGGLLQLEGFN